MHTADHTMSQPHPQDTNAALEWAVKQAEAAAKTDELVRLTHLPALRSLRDQAARDSRGGA